MVGEEEVAAAGSRGQCQISGNNRKMFWRSASWSSSRTSQQSPAAQFDEGKDCANQDNNNNGGQFRRFPVPLTPRSQQNCKARACLPPLQPLSIARRSLDEWPKAGSDDIGEWPQPSTPSGRGDSSKHKERLKLDLSSFQRNPEPSGSLASRDRIAFFDKECSKVADHIYLGGDAVARNRDILRQNNITHVLNCVGFVCPEYFKSDLVYKTLWLQDSPSEDITSILYDVFDYFEDVREQGGKVLVHCCQGVSRSTSLVIAYLMWREGQSFDDAFQYVKAARGIANPNMGFACQLLQCQKRVHAVPLSPSSVLRMYRMAPHSPYDPLHLVPKMLNDPSLNALDSRGAFIIHVPSAIYVWVGKICEPIMARDAKGAAYQVVHYERVQGPIITIEEGQEPSEFWDTFCNLPLSMDSGTPVGKEQVDAAAKIDPGKRKVDAYNVDFELFQKAVTGGVVPPFSSSEAGHETRLPARESNWSVLRRKFACGYMKEFVSAPKVSLCRVYSDSMLIVDSDHSCANKNLPFSADSSNSSSPSYSSPCSISSDSTCGLKSSSESPRLSPSTSACSLTLSPASLALPDSSLVLFEKSIHPTCNNSLDAKSVSHTSKLCSQTVLTPLKRIPLSLAERRGSLSPSLKLSILKEDASASSGRVHAASPINLASQQDGIKRNSISCSVNKPFHEDVLQSKKGPVDKDRVVVRENHLEMGSGRPLVNCSIKRNSISCSVNKPFNEDVLQSKEGPVDKDGVVIQESHLEMGSGRPLGNCSCSKETTLVQTCGESLRTLYREEVGKVSVSAGLVDGALRHCNPSQTFVCRWPGLEKIIGFGSGDLNSESAFLFLAPSKDVWSHGDRVLYLWIGKSFKLDNCLIHQHKKKDVGEVEEIDWKQISSDFFALMGLPKNSLVKVVKEKEEPAEFVEMLSSF